jgi:tetratricopeptide (TPR) repeat protein
VLVILSDVTWKSAAFVVILLVFTSATARAADDDPAALAYQRALSRYAAGDIQGALTDMNDSLRLSGRWELLYNIARLQDELGRCPDALASYREYLGRVPDGQYRAAAAQASDALEARCPPAEEQPELALAATGVATDAATSAALAATMGPATPAVEPAPPAPLPPPVAPPRAVPPPDASGSTQRWLGWSAIGAGGVAGVAAIYFTVSAHDARSAYARSVKREEDGGPVSDESLRDRQHRDTRWAQVLAVTGGALLGGGVVLLVLSGRKQPASAGVTAGVWFSADGVTGQLSSCF